MIHHKPFVSTVAGAIDFIECQRMHAGLAPLPAADRLFALERQTVALIAHDALKQDMFDFAGEHFDLLSRFATRVATGTTGQGLNELAWSRGWPGTGSGWCATRAGRWAATRRSPTASSTTAASA